MTQSSGVNLSTLMILDEDSTVAVEAVYAARRFYAEREVAFEHEMGKV